MLTADKGLTSLVQANCPFSITTNEGWAMATAEATLEVAFCALL